MCALLLPPGLKPWTTRLSTESLSSLHIVPGKEPRTSALKTRVEFLNKPLCPGLKNGRPIALFPGPLFSPVRRARPPGHAAVPAAKRPPVAFESQRDAGVPGR